MTRDSVEVQGRHRGSELESELNPQRPSSLKSEKLTNIKPRMDAEIKESLLHMSLS